MGMWWEIIPSFAIVTGKTNIFKQNVLTVFQICTHKMSTFVELKICLKRKEPPVEVLVENELSFISLDLLFKLN